MPTNNPCLRSCINYHKRPQQPRWIRLIGLVTLYAVVWLREFRGRRGALLVMWLLLVIGAGVMFHYAPHISKEFPIVGAMFIVAGLAGLLQGYGWMTRLEALLTAPIRSSTVLAALVVLQGIRVLIPLAIFCSTLWVLHTWVCPTPAWYLLDVAWWLLVGLAAEIVALAAGTNAFAVSLLPAIETGVVRTKPQRTCRCGYYQFPVWVSCTTIGGIVSILTALC